MKTITVIIDKKGESTLVLEGWGKRREQIQAIFGRGTSALR
jgi:hypothetical protein